MFDKKAKKKDLAKLRVRLDELSPADPEYNQVRNLYTSMIINEHLHNLSHNNSLSCGTNSPHNSVCSGGDTHHSSVDYSCGSDSSSSD